MSHDCLEVSRSEVCGRSLRAGDWLWLPACGRLPAGDCLRRRVGAGECGRAKQTHSLGIECGVGKFFECRFAASAAAIAPLWDCCLRASPCRLPAAAPAAGCLRHSPAGGRVRAGQTALAAVECGRREIFFRR